MARKPCSVRGCTKESKGRGWCGTHWLRWRKYGDPLYLKPRKLASRCSVEECGAVLHAHGYCSPHLYRFQTYGDPLVEGPGKSSGRPRMDEPSYDGMHKRIFYDRGKADKHKCADCGKQAHEWSYNGGCPNELYEVKEILPLAYSTDQSRYSPRCRSCHRHRDDSLIRDRGKNGQWVSS